MTWIVDDSGILKESTHSVGVARQHCGQQRKQDKCQVAVTLSLAAWQVSLPVAYRLYLPPETTLKELVRLARHRWIVERDYLELKQELPTGTF